MTAPNLSPSAVLEAVLAEILATDEAHEIMGEQADDAVFFASIRSFDDCGVLTTDRGLVVRLSNGQEFQITIVQSR